MYTFLDSRIWEFVESRLRVLLAAKREEGFAMPLMAAVTHRGHSAGFNDVDCFRSISSGN